MLRRHRHEAVLGIPPRLLLGVCAVGAMGGAGGAAYVGLLHLLDRTIGPGSHSGAVQIVILTAVGLAVALLVRFLGSPGDVELLVDNIHVLGGKEDLHEMRSLLPASLLCIGAGGAMGPEAPLVQTTGSLGSWVARRGRASRSELRILTITGMAAGFTVLFGTPIGGAFFALEILHRRGMEYYEALVPALVGSLFGYGVHALLTGVGLRPVWIFPDAGGLAPGDFGWALVAGAGGAVIGIAFAGGATLLRSAIAAVPVALRPVLGGLALGLLALWSPFALTFGERQIQELVDGNLAIAALSVAFVAKLVGTVVTLVTGWRGGFIIPLFFCGAAIACAIHAAVPGTNQAVLMAAFMAAASVAVTKTPVGSSLVVAGMAGLPLLPTTLLASVTALLLTNRIGFIHTQRDRIVPVPRTGATGAAA
ncbi:MAG: chloride channel protein [Acidimicrobiia bacterium]